jgi:hypothetical protein
MLLLSLLMGMWIELADGPVYVCMRISMCVALCAERLKRDRNPDYVPVP